MHAHVIYVSLTDGAETIAVNGHGDGGDGSCYAHQSFECVDALTSDEHDAIQNAEAGQAVPDEQL